jgi:hypothetical protein
MILLKVKVRFCDMIHNVLQRELLDEKKLNENVIAYSQTWMYKTEL